MTELEGVAKTIYDEVMDEIEEEILEALDSVILEEKLVGIIEEVRTESASQILEIINENYSNDMSAAKKMILGEKLARAVIGIAKPKIQDLVSNVIAKSFTVIEELRNEIIGEVFEETE